ncbi:hypothetical protein EC968_010258 [Mortierella alpina]|nr:hypothetical protein EC968_010258 [Mortierella alpina]
MADGVRMCITAYPCTDLINEDGLNVVAICISPAPQTTQRSMLLPTRKSTSKPQKKVEVISVRLPNCDMFLSSKLHRYFIALASSYRELESEACVEGVTHNRKRFLAIYDEMLQERVPFMDHGNIALLRAAAVLNTEHQSACLHRAIVLKQTSVYKSKKQPLKNATLDRPAASTEDVFQTRRRLKLHYTQILQNWINSHPTHPFPTKTEKIELSRKAAITEKQLNNWFTNYRRRHL